MSIQLAQLCMISTRPQLLCKETNLLHGRKPTEPTNGLHNFCSPGRSIVVIWLPYDGQEYSKRRLKSEIQDIPLQAALAWNFCVLEKGYDVAEIVKRKATTQSGNKTRQYMVSERAGNSASLLYTIADFWIDEMILRRRPCCC